MIDHIRSDPSDKVMLQTQDGGVLLEKNNILRLNITDDKDPLNIETIILDDEAFVVPTPIIEDVKEPEDNEITISDEDFHNLLKMEEEKKKHDLFKNDSRPEELSIMLQEGVQPMTEEQDLEVTKIGEKRQSFREKFLDREAKGDAWENTIIEKQDKRLVMLEDFAGVLDKENLEFEKFKKDKLG